MVFLSNTIVAMASSLNLLEVQNDILCAIDNQNCVVLLLLGISVPFDTVDYKLLLTGLSRRFGIKGKVSNWLESYLHDRKQCVVIDGVKSNTKDLQYGVPEGSVLDPVLYALYTFPLGDIIKCQGLGYYSYTDDTQLYFAFQPIPAEQL